MYRLLLPLLFLCACSSSPQENTADSVPPPKTTQQLLDSILWAELEKDVLCDILYDTITNPHYDIHKLIMYRCSQPDSLGYWLTPEGDTLDKYLYPQNIGVFFQELDPNEQGIYRTLTNEVVFEILNYDSYDVVFPTWYKDKESYFLWHVSHPMCTDLPIDTTIARVERNLKIQETDKTDHKTQILECLRALEK